jgi:hypothetical protein
MNRLDSDGGVGDFIRRNFTPPCIHSAIVLCEPQSAMNRAVQHFERLATTETSRPSPRLWENSKVAVAELLMP